ncbi:MAG: di-heme oxidoredictase family protein [Pseudomonadota bacterium]
MSVLAFCAPPKQSKTKRTLDPSVRFLRFLLAIVLTASSNGLWANPALPGGATTHERADNRQSFSHASTNLRAEERMSFTLGNAIFRKRWVAAPASTASSDGLGPLYNARSCQRCHVKDGRGAPHGTLPVLGVSGSVIALRNAMSFGGDPVYGMQLQDFAVPGLAAEGKVSLIPESVERYGQTLTRWQIGISDLSASPIHPDTRLSLRVAPHMIGLGLLEAIPAEAIRAAADPDDRDRDGISGRAADLSDGMLGRFGWKAHSPSVRDQSSGAFHTDMGLGTPARPTPSGDCTAAQKSCVDAPHGPDANGFEVSEKMMRWITFYASHLAPPHRPDAREPHILRGEAIFNDIGCAACHTPSWQTGPSEFPALANQRIYPYTDLLLHDLGEGLAEGAPDKVATRREWRTPPLWGLGRIRDVNEHLRLLHDGRADGVAEAIGWHGGEGEQSAAAFFALDEAAMSDLVAFVESL